MSGDRGESHPVVAPGEPAPEPVHHRLPWLETGDPESRWPVSIALITAMALQWAVGRQGFIAVPHWHWLLIALEALLLMILVVINPTSFTRTNRLEWAASKALLGAITVDNIVSAIVLDTRILTHHEVNTQPEVLFGSGGAVFLTNVIAFGIIYWEIDLGGPFARGGAGKALRHPDFLFPQTDKPRIAGAGWTPLFLDYLYLSFTNVVAFSAADTLPLTRPAKALMALQSTVAVSTLALVIARAVGALDPTPPCAVT